MMDNFPEIVKELQKKLDADAKAGGTPRSIVLTPASIPQPTPKPKSEHSHTGGRGGGCGDCHRRGTCGSMASEPN